MQISRHWRLNATRYRLEGVRYANGSVSLQERPLIASSDDDSADTAEQPAENREEHELSAA